MNKPIKNTILIIATNKYWPGISRLPTGLSRAGFQTYALCPRGSFLSLSNFLNGGFFFPTLTYSRSKIFYIYAFFAILWFKPDFIIPGDEEAILVLQNLRKLLRAIKPLNSVLNILNRSLPSADFDSLLFSKAKLMFNCEKWGVSVPKNISVSNQNELISAANKIGYPVVLKIDAGYGGAGVHICKTEDELTSKFNLEKKHSLIQKIKFKLKDYFFITIFKKDSGISVQQFLDLQRGHCSFIALDGVKIANNPMLTVQSHPGRTGPSSVSRALHNEDITLYAIKIIHELKYSGFGSFDYMYDHEKNKIYIIELNARPTPWAHYSSDVVTNDLCQILFDRLNGKEIKLNTPKDYTIALFPNEKKRDPNSPYLKSAYYDIPVNDDRLKRALDN